MSGLTHAKESAADRQRENFGGSTLAGRHPASGSAIGPVTTGRSRRADDGPAKYGLRQRRLMFVAVYRWRLKSGMEDQFVDGWERVTRAIRRSCGSYGSRHSSGGVLTPWLAAHAKPGHLRGAALEDAETHWLAALVHVEANDNPDPNALAPQQVRIRLTDGRVLDWACDVMLANPARPLTREAHLAKFRRCWDFAADALPEASRDALISLVDRLEDVADVREMIGLLVP